MAQAFARALALMFAATPAFAGSLPAHPPVPPARPVFPGDPPPETQPPQAEEQPAETTPQAEAPVNVPTPPEARVDLPKPPYDPRPREPDPEGFGLAEQAGLADLTRSYAARNGVPLALLHRIIMRESKYRPTAHNRSYYGLMQITHATAKNMGYKGSAKGLLDAEINLAYATPYLANAWALSDGDMNKAVKLYAAGYYYTAKARGMLGVMRNGHSPPVKPEASAPQEQPTLAAPPQSPGFLESLFGR